VPVAVVSTQELKQAGQPWLSAAGMLTNTPIPSTTLLLVLLLTPLMRTLMLRNSSEISPVVVI